MFLKNIVPTSYFTLKVLIVSLVKYLVEKQGAMRNGSEQCDYVFEGRNQKGFDSQQLVYKKEDLNSPLFIYAGGVRKRCIYDFGLEN